MASTYVQRYDRSKAQFNDLEPLEVKVNDSNMWMVSIFSLTFKTCASNLGDAFSMCVLIKSFFFAPPPFSTLPPTAHTSHLPFCTGGWRMRICIIAAHNFSHCCIRPEQKLLLSWGLAAFCHVIIRGPVNGKNNLEARRLRSTFVFKVMTISCYIIVQQYNLTVYQIYLLQFCWDKKKSINISRQSIYSV